MSLVLTPKILYAYGFDQDEVTTSDSTLRHFFERISAITSIHNQLDTLLYYSEFYGKDNFDRSLKVAKLGKQRAQEFGLIEYIAKFNLELALTYSSLAQYDSSLVYYNKTIKFAKEQGDHVMLANRLKSKGFIKVNQGNFTDAFTIYMQALDIFENLQDHVGIVQVYNKLSDVLFFLERYEEGVAYGKRAENLFEKTKDKHALYDSYHNITSNLIGTSEYDQALSYIDKALALAQQLKVSQLGMASLNNSRGNTLKNMGKYDDALKSYMLCYDVVKAINHPSGLSATLANISDVYMRQGDFANALHYQLESYELMEKHNFHMNRLENIENLSIIHKELRQFEKALEFRELHQILRDSVLSLEKDKATKELSTKYETEKKEQLIAAQKEKLDRQRLIQLLSFGFAALLGLLLFLSIKNARIRKQTNEKLKELDTLKNRLNTNITHEFRTPLTVITGMATQIKDNPIEWLDEGLAMISRNGNILLDLVNQMLDLNKLESGKVQVNNQQGDIVIFLNYIVESMHSFAESEEVELYFQSEKNAINMDYDAEKMQRIMINLLSNAIKFTPEGGHIYVFANTVANGAKQKTPLLQIKIRDTGKGISQDQLPFIFDRFYQVDNSSTRATAGSGIGLALVRELVNLMDGDISVKSTLEIGTEFTVLLPISNTAVKVPDNFLDRPMKKVGFQMPVSADHSAVIQVDDSIASIEENKPRVLIIEDNPDVVTYLVSCLQDKYRLQVGLNGQKGIDLAIEHIPDLIITDVMMPIKDGFEVTKFLKADERTSHIPIIMLTAKADVASKLEGLKRGADAYLAKPFDKEELKIRIEQLILIRQKLSARYAAGQLMDLPPTQDENIKIEDAFLIKINGFILAELSNTEYGVGDLVTDAGMSRSQLYRKLKALTNRSIVAYIRSIRLQESVALLKQSDKNISEIAYEVGFADPSYFSRVFTQEFGKSPAQFKEESN